MTNPALSGEPGPGGTCRVCHEPLDGSLRCMNCGAAYGEANRCPHCRAVTDVDPSDLLGFRCRVCGGPRVAVADPGVLRTGREIPVLTRAQREYTRSAAFRTAAFVVLTFGVLALLLSTFALALTTPGLLVVALTLSLPIVALVSGAWALRRGQRHRAAVREHVREATALVAADVLASRRSDVTQAELAQILRLSESQAEAVLAQLNLHDFVHARVTDQGDIAYSVRGERLRVPEAGETAPLGESAPADTFSPNDAELAELDALIPPTPDNKRGSV